MDKIFDKSDSEAESIELGSRDSVELSSSSDSSYQESSDKSNSPPPAPRKRAFLVNALDDTQRTTMVLDLVSTLFPAYPEKRDPQLKKLLDLLKEDCADPEQMRPIVHYLRQSGVLPNQYKKTLRKIDELLKELEK